MTVAAAAAIRPLVIGESPDRVRSVKLGTADCAGVSAAVAAGARGTTVRALGNFSLATTRLRLSDEKLIASPCGESGSGVRTGAAARAPGTSEPDSGHT